MATDYPAAIDSFDTHVDNVDDVMAADVNDLNDAVVAIETELGIQPRHTAAVAPTVNDDTAYSVGTIWTNTTADEIWICIDNTDTAAVWHNVGSAWNTWTPTITQSGAVAATVTRARYKIVNKICHTEVSLAVTAAGTAANAIVIGGQPAAIQPSYSYTPGGFPIGVAQVVNAGTATYVANVATLTATTFQFRAGATDNWVGVNPNFALANGDFIFFTATYEVA